MVKNKGFTLIELLIVIAIIGVLVTIVIIAINPARLIQDARDTTARSDLQQVKAAMQLYYNECKDYPPTVTINGLWGAQFGPLTGGVPCDDSTTYMRQMPNNDANFVYTRVNASSYTITANMNTRTADDTSSMTKCGITPPAQPSTVDFAVCND